MVETLSHKQARRIALAAQGFADNRPAKPTRRHLIADDRAAGPAADRQRQRRLALALPAAVLAPGRLSARPAGGPGLGPKPTLFEYWGHEASLMPLDLQPLLRWRMEDARQGVGVWGNVARFLAEHRPFIDKALAAIHERGPLSAGELELGERGQGGWWGWSEAKRATECLFWAGELTTATRRGTFERVYGLPEEVLPKAIWSAPTPVARRGPSRPAAPRGPRHGRGHRARPARLFPHGPGRRPARRRRTGRGRRPDAGRGRGLEPAGLSGPRRPAPRRIVANALLSPFDNLIWFRERAERLFDVRIRLEIYTPAPKRTHGYYVLPFLQGEAITARVDLKADRKAGLLRVLSAHREPAANAATPAALATELRLMAAWLGLAGVAVASSGDLSSALAGQIADD
jgi:uncharacterized protein YcaQ